MSKRLGMISVAIAAMLALGVITPAAGSTGGVTKDRTIRVSAVITELSLIDAGTAGPSLGDEIVFSNKLLAGGKEIGHEGAVCTTVSLQRQEAQCVATFSFSGGQITAQGLVSLGSLAPYAVPITGGSGKYNGAGGELQVHPVSGTEGILTLRLQG